MDSIETRMGKKTIELQHLSKRYGDKVILDDYSYIFLRNQKVGIIGPNGCGKSTLMKMLVGQVAPDSGVIEIGETIRMGYFAQDEKEMDDRQRVIDYVKDIGEYIITRDGRISDDEIKDFALISKKLDEISLAIDSLNLWVDKTAGEQGLNIELLREEKKKQK